MPQRSMSPLPLPRPPRLPSFHAGFDACYDDEPSVIVLDDLDIGARETLEVAEDDIVTGVIDRDARRALDAHLRSLSAQRTTPTAPAPPPPLANARRPRQLVAFDPCEATAPAFSRTVVNEPPRPASRTSSRGSMVLAVALGAIAFVAGWRLTGGEAWLAHSTLRPHADRALVALEGAKHTAITALGSSTR